MIHVLPMVHVLSMATHLFTGPLLALNQAPQRVGIIVACLQMLHCPGSPRPNRPTVTAMVLS